MLVPFKETGFYGGIEDCANGKRLGGGSSRCNKVFGGTGNGAEID